MVIDITLEGNRFLVKFLKSMFLFPYLEAFCEGSHLVGSYKHLGDFSLTDTVLGFGGCLSKVSEDETSVTFAFSFPEQKTEDKRGQPTLQFSDEGSQTMSRFIGTLYLLFEYVMDSAEYDKLLTQEDIADQSLSFSFGMSSGRRYVSGNAYPWFSEKLKSLSDDALQQLNSHVRTEMDRFSEYSVGEKTFCSQVTITRESWYIQSGMGGVWINSEGKPRNRWEFSSHNCDVASDQRILFAAMVAMNTFLRNH